MRAGTRHIPVRSTGDLGPPPHQLGPTHEDGEYRLEPPRPCAYCGVTIDAARVVRLEELQYAYACAECTATNHDPSVAF